MKKRKARKREDAVADNISSPRSLVDMTASVTEHFLTVWGILPRLHALERQVRELETKKLDRS